MKVIDRLIEGSPTLSFEFFPPKTLAAEKELLEVVGTLKKFEPDFVSVTYGAMGQNQNKSFSLVSEIKRSFQIEPVAHLTCINMDENAFLMAMADLKEKGIENILALRGDRPLDNLEESKDTPFQYASDLVARIKTYDPHLCLGVAGYPEGHPESNNMIEDIWHLKEKIEAGGEYVISQLFFDNDHFFRFLDLCHKGGITVPIVPGMMPIISLKQVKKMTEMCGATIPKELLLKLEKYQDEPESILKLGIEQAIYQCQEILDQGIKQLHFFVLNRAESVSAILNSITF